MRDGVKKRQRSSDHSLGCLVCLLVCFISAIFDDGGRDHRRINTCLQEFRNQKEGRTDQNSSLH